MNPMWKNPSVPPNSAFSRSFLYTSSSTRRLSVFPDLSDWNHGEAWTGQASLGRVWNRPGWDPGRGTLQPMHCKTLAAESLLFCWKIQLEFVATKPASCNEPTKTTSVELAYNPSDSGQLVIWSLIHGQPWSEGLHKGTWHKIQKDTLHLPLMPCANLDIHGNWPQPGTQSSSHLCRKTFPKS